MPQEPHVIVRGNSLDLLLSLRESIAFARDNEFCVGDLPSYRGHHCNQARKPLVRLDPTEVEDRWLLKLLAAHRVLAMVYAGSDYTHLRAHETRHDLVC